MGTHMLVAVIVVRATVETDLVPPPLQLGAQL
jgi:hypothetical protein